MNNLQKPKSDTPVRKSSNNSTNKTVTLDNIWSLLSSIDLKVNTYDSGLKDINNKLSNLDSTVNGIKKSLNKISLDLTQVKKENENLTSELQLLRQRISNLEQSNSSIPLPDFDIVKESHDRLSKENNLIIFNVSDNISEETSDTINLTNEIFQELSSPILVSRAKRIGTPGNRPRPILIQLNSRYDVFSILRIKSKIRSSTRWKNISISMDMTEIQRNNMKSLRSQLKAKRDSGDTSWFIKYISGIPKLLQKN